MKFQLYNESQNWIKSFHRKNCFFSSDRNELSRPDPDLHPKRHNLTSRLWCPNFKMFLFYGLKVLKVSPQEKQNFLSQILVRLNSVDAQKKTNKDIHGVREALSPTGFLYVQQKS